MKSLIGEIESNASFKTVGDEPTEGGLLQLDQVGQFENVR